MSEVHERSQEKHRYDILLSSIHCNASEGIRLANSYLCPYPSGYYHISGNNPFEQDHKWQSEGDKKEWENALNDNYGSVLCIDINPDKDADSSNFEYELNNSLNALNIVAELPLTYGEKVTYKGYDKTTSEFNKPIIVGQMSPQLVLPTILSVGKSTKGRAPSLNFRPGLYIRDLPPVYINERDKTIIEDNGFLDNINYHYGQERVNGGYHQISSNIIGAIEDYNQSGLFYDKRSLYKYLIAFENALLGTANRMTDVDAEQLSIIAGYSYVLMRDYLIKLEAPEFERLRKFYNQLKHGNKLDTREITQEDIGKAKLLARSAIIVVAKIARDNEWQHWNESKNWINDLRNSVDYRRKVLGEWA